MISCRTKAREEAGTVQISATVLKPGDSQAAGEIAFKRNEPRHRIGGMSFESFDV